MSRCPTCQREVQDATFCPHDGTPIAIIERSAAERGVAIPTGGLWGDVAPPETIGRLGRLPSVLPSIGHDIDGRYRLIEELGRGGMAVVFRARNLALSKDVALKILRPRWAEDRRTVARFAREARAASQIDHDNVVRVYDFGYAEPGYYFLAMELLTGGPLREMVKGRRVRSSRALSILLQIADGMARAHELGVIHRDLKPENVMVCRRRGRHHVTIVDFGLSKVDDNAAMVTQDGDVLGTPDYMAPEQWRGKGVDARADVYSWGIMAYELFAGAVPFDGESIIAKLQQHMDAEPLELARHAGAKDVPPGMSALVMSCLAKDVSRRPPHMGDVHAELLRIREEDRAGRRGTTRGGDEGTTVFAVVADGTLDRRGLMDEIARLRRVRQYRLAMLTPEAFGAAMPAEVRALIASIEHAERTSDAAGEHVALAEASVGEARRAQRQKEAELRGALLDANLHLAVARSALPDNVTSPGLPTPETIDLAASQPQKPILFGDDVERARNQLDRAEHKLAVFISDVEAIGHAQQRFDEALAQSSNADAALTSLYETLERILAATHSHIVEELSQLDSAIHHYRARLEHFDEL